MDIITYIILGIIQGITEPIPVSSSGHIFLFKNLFMMIAFMRMVAVGVVVAFALALVFACF